MIDGILVEYTSNKGSTNLPLGWLSSTAFLIASKCETVHPSSPIVLPFTPYNRTEIRLYV